MVTPLSAKEHFICILIGSLSLLGEFKKNKMIPDKIINLIAGIREN